MLQKRAIPRPHRHVLHDRVRNRRGDPQAQDNEEQNVHLRAKAPGYLVTIVDPGAEHLDQEEHERVQGEY